MATESASNPSGIVMQPSAEERTARSDRSPNTQSRQHSTGRDGSTPQSLQRIGTPPADSRPSPRSIINRPPSSLTDSRNRLEQLRRAVQDLEARSSTSQSSLPSTSSNEIGPSHSAIVLSEADPDAQVDTEALRNRLDGFRADLPEYMRAAAEIIRAMRSGTTPRNPEDTVFSRGSIASARPATEPIGPRPYSSRSPTSDAASGVYARSRRDNNNPSQDSIPITTNSQDDSAPYSYARRVAIRDESREVLNNARRFPPRDDGSATILGRHVAARAAATARDRPAEGPRTESYSREMPLSERLAAPLRRRPNNAVSGSTSASRPAGARISMTPHAARQFAQNEAVSLFQTITDSEGSETEVDDSLSRWAGRVRDQGVRIRPRRENGRPPGDPPDLEPVSPITSSEGTSSGSNSGSPPLRVETSRYSPRQRDIWELMNEPVANPRSRRFPAAQMRRNPDENNTSMWEWDRPQEAARAYRNVVETEEGRTYHIRRRLNADGEEQVHRINSDMLREVDDLNSMAATFREGVLRQTQGSETDLPPLNMDQPLQTTTRRRRGWVRLNRDGDEIPTDEEEEIERARTEQRIRNSQPTWRDGIPSSTSRTRLSYLPDAPATRSVFTDDEESAENDVRVRLNIPPRESMRGSVRRMEEIISAMRKDGDSAPEVEQVYFGTSEPYYLNPLPMSLEDVSSLDTAPRTRYQPLGEMEIAAR